MSIQALLDSWKRDLLTAENIVTWRTLPPRPAQTDPFPDDLPAPLRGALASLGISSLYSHQHQAWTHTRAGKNVVLATGTASGKTLAYNLPVLAALLENPEARALYLFPTKALTQDQLNGLSRFPVNPLVVNGTTGKRLNLPTAIYDGDTPQRNRPSIRKNARILLTNPDMLHTGILPHHTSWADLFRNLRYVVIDELHTYRGVFGSHVANVIRRLKRVAAFYGANPQFILTSATIGNPQELAEKLTETPVTLIGEDGSSRGERHFLIYNPPLVDESLGLRKSALLESVRLAQDALTANVQTVVFARSRRSVEIILTYLQVQSPLSLPGRGAGGEGQIRGYRSGYLPSQRREIEKGLRDGTVRAVVATNALELGIDIGGLGAAVLVGYPGTVASAWQQAGRAGRGDAPAAAVLVASASPLDQFLAHHPEYFLGRSPEQALVNPDHLLILLEHLRCAMFELPFVKGERFGQMDVDEFLEFLVANREAHESNDKFFWMSDQYPAANISLRSASPASVTLQINYEKPLTIGTVDGESATWMVHPGAVYLHEAQSYFVESLDLEQKIAMLRPGVSDYYTEPLRDTTVKPLAIGEWSKAEGCEKAWGELQVTMRVKGFTKRRWYTHETLGSEPLDLPPRDLQTTGYWISISDETVANLSEAGLWTNAPNDYGPAWPQIRERVRARDSYKCQMCGRPELTPSGTGNRQHDVHHKVPFRMFMRTATSPDVAIQSRETLRQAQGNALDSAIARANQLDNLVTLCPECHKKAETAVRVRSGLAGLSYGLGNLAPLFLMCDPGDLGTHIEPVGTADFPQPAVVLYDLIPAGIGFSQKLYELHDELVKSALELVEGCACLDGCPSCVGPGGENGMGGRQETLAILQELAYSD